MFTATKDGVTVKMISPGTGTGIPLSGMHVLFHSDKNPAKLKKPLPITGNYSPATFITEGLDCVVTFTLSQVTKSTPGRRYESLQITSYSVVCENDNYAKGIPLDLLLSLGVRASTFSAVILPPHFSYTEHGITWKTDSDGSYFITGEGDLPTEVQESLTDLTESEFFKHLGEVWSNSPHGEQIKSIRAAFTKPDGSQWGVKWADKKIAAGKKFYPQYFKVRPTKKGKAKK